MVWDRANPVLNKHKIDPGLYPAVVQFLGAGYENLLPGFEIGGGFSGNRGDLGSRSHKDFLLAVLGDIAFVVVFKIIHAPKICSGKKRGNALGP